MLTLGVTRVRCKRKWLTIFRGRIRATRVPGQNAKISRRPSMKRRNIIR